MTINRDLRLSLILLFTSAIAMTNVNCASMKKNVKDCGGDYSGYQYTIASPNYPENYPPDRYCVYTLRGNRFANCDQSFHLQFLDFSLPISKNCYRDYLEIGERTVYCGIVTGVRTYPSKNNSLTVRFRSDVETRGMGFKILVTASPCADPQIDEHDDANSTENSEASTTTNETKTKIVNDEKIGSPNNFQPIDLVETIDVHKNSRPQVDFVAKENRRVEKEDREPLGIGNGNANEKNVATGVRKNVDNDPVEIFELPVHRSEPFRDSPITKLTIVKPISPMIGDNASSKISAYLFVPPGSNDDSKYLNEPSKFFAKNDKTGDFTAEPSAEFVLPNKRTFAFRDDKSTIETSKFLSVDDRRRFTERPALPARSYGVPAEIFYPIAKITDYETKTRESSDDPTKIVNCDEKNNSPSDLNVVANFANYDSTSIVNAESQQSKFRNDYNLPIFYGAPGSSYPTKVPNVNFAPDFVYGPPIGNYPIVTVGRPVDRSPITKNFVPITGWPTNGLANGYPNFIAKPVDSGGSSHCCRSEYSAQRFFIASPGFPSLLHSGNSYDCVYNVRTNSANVCNVRYNFLFFNHGIDDATCSRGYVAIDGRKICGCKRGLTVLSPISAISPKTIAVRYTGFPRTKFNGFVIEVVQEPCYNGYPYSSRIARNAMEIVNPKIVEFDSTEKFDVSNFRRNRTKRNLGYSYPKPNVGFNDGSSGFESSWNSLGNSLNPGNRGSLEASGTSENFFGPITACRVLSFVDWINAAKMVYVGGARCVRSGAVDNAVPVYPGGWYPSNDGSASIDPGYAGNAGWNVPSSGCESVNVVEGIVSSPQYPNNYPNNVNMCFRFYKSPGSCQLEVAFLDFDLEDSTGCSKDYVSIGAQNRRYCGRSLAGSTSLIDISRLNVIDMYFVSDGYGSGRGFSIGFSQIPCGSLVHS